jgi:hypothetical protein
MCKGCDSIRFSNSMAMLFLLFGICLLKEYHGQTCPKAGELGH